MLTKGSAEEVRSYLQNQHVQSPWGRNLLKEKDTEEWDVEGGFG